MPLQTNRDGCPICPYCDWSFGEWMDGKSQEKEKIECPNCEKIYHCHSYHGAEGYSHKTTRLGRPPKKCS